VTLLRVSNFIFIYYSLFQLSPCLCYRSFIDNTEEKVSLFTVAWYL